MAGQRGKSPTPDEMKRRVMIVEDALDGGAISYNQICKATELTESNLQVVFKNFPDTHKKYRVNLMGLKLQASANLVNIMCDPTHPKHFEANKTFLAKYKTELDEVFEQHDNQGVVLNPNRGGLEITFKPQTEEEG